MKGTLSAVVELQAKYVSLGEYKKHSCINIDKLVPEIKFKKTQNEASDDEDLSEKREEQIKINKRKRRRYKNSFINASNLVLR